MLAWLRSYFKKSNKTSCKICGANCGQCGGAVTNPSYIWDKNTWNKQTLSYGDWIRNA